MFKKRKYRKEQTRRMANKIFELELDKSRLESRMQELEAKVDMLMDLKATEKERFDRYCTDRIFAVRGREMAGEKMKKPMCEIIEILKSEGGDIK